jgi:hypothetical protein
MNSEQDLIQKLMISKKIMEKHNDMGRNGIQSTGGMSSPMVEDYQPVQANYNLPQEFLSEQEVTKPVNNGPMTSDRILGSKLPDEIKKLMMEHPIQQPTMGAGTGTLSNELVEKASRLMNTNAKGELLENKQPQKQQQRQPQQSNVGVDANVIRDIVRETVQDVLRENGLLTESETKSNEVFKFRVGQHIFEGKLVKVKKIAR